MGGKITRGGGSLGGQRAVEEVWLQATLGVWLRQRANGFSHLSSLLLSYKTFVVLRKTVAEVVRDPRDQTEDMAMSLPMVFCDDRARHAYFTTRLSLPEDVGGGR